jgi:hypothetical protein
VGVEDVAVFDELQKLAGCRSRNFAAAFAEFEARCTADRASPMRLSGFVVYVQAEAETKSGRFSWPN